MTLDEIEKHFKDALNANSHLFQLANWAALFGQKLIDVARAAEEWQTPVVSKALDELEKDV